MILHLVFLTFSTLFSFHTVLYTSQIVAAELDRRILPPPAFSGISFNSAGVWHPTEAIVFHSFSCLITSLVLSLLASIPHTLPLFDYSLFTLCAGIHYSFLQSPNRTIPSDILAYASIIRFPRSLLCRSSMVGYRVSIQSCSNFVSVIQHPRGCNKPCRYISRQSLSRVSFELA